MEKLEMNEGNGQYVAPVIEDYGTLQELTAANGSTFIDVPIGTVVANAGPGGVAGSTP
jgi:hypothetical protein